MSIDDGLSVKIKPEFILKKVVKEDVGEKVNHDKENSEGKGQHQQKKKRGRNQKKDRPPPIKFQRKDTLCPVFIDVSPTREKK